MKFKLFLVMFSITFFSFLVPHGLAELQEQEYETYYTAIHLIIKEVSLSTQSATFSLNCSVEGLLYNKTALLIDLSNNWENTEYGIVRSTGNHVFYLPREQIVNDSGRIWLKYSGNYDFRFGLFGVRELYPYDSYMANLTFRINNFEVPIEKDRISVFVYTWPEEWQAQRSPIISVKNYNGFSYVTVPIIVHRMTWENQYFATFFMILTIAIGMIDLLKPNNSKLGIYLTLLISVNGVLLQFSEINPVKTGRTIATQSLLILMAAVLVYLISDILIIFLNGLEISDEWKKRYKFSIDYSAPIVPAILLWTIWFNYKEIAARYQWVLLPEGFGKSAAIFLMIGLLIKTLVGIFLARNEILITIRVKSQRYLENILKIISFFNRK